MPTTRFRALAAACLVALCSLACARPEAVHEPDPRYAEIIDELSGYIEYQLADKEIPGLSIALVDGDELVWAEGFGTADPETGVAASAETVYRIGSVSKLFTDIGIMQLVERGEIDLDAPVTDYLPRFTPANPFGKEITLRQLMSHRSGLVREPPVGHYFDASSPTLAATVASLNDTELVYEPETRIKYSNAAIAAVGYVLETLSGEPFAGYLERRVLEPMGMDDSAFAPDDEIRRRLAGAVMWSYDGRRFPAPTFELGMAPAGSMYSPVTDLAKFMRVLFAGGSGSGGQVIEPETLQEMFTVQYPEEEDQQLGFGIGFSIDELDGHRSYGHGGAIYGFATTFAVLPEERLGAVAVANMDVVNSVTGRIVDLALRLALARREGRELELSPATDPVDPELAERLEGRYRGDDLTVDLWALGDELVLESSRSRYRVRSRGDALVLDDRLVEGFEIAPTESGGLLVGGEIELARVEAGRPEPTPERFLGLLGEYGWDHNVLFVYEKRGQLHALVEWTEIDPMLEVEGAADVYDFPDGRLYHGERLVFHRDESGRAHEAVLAGIVFPRRHIQGETAATFVIEPVRPVDDLREAALAAQPPEEEGDFLPTDLVEPTSLDPTIRLDIRYATTNNFMRTRFYHQPRAFLQRPAAEALVRVHRSLAERGYGLLIHDAYRPWYVTRMFWDATPEEHKHFVADPSQGSRHNRGCAVDLTLVDLATGEPIEMVGLYDEFSERSYPDYMGGTERQRWHRELLRDAMEAEGFSVYEYEWWHYDFEGWERYRIGNEVFEDL